MSDWKTVSNFSLGCDATDFVVDDDGRKIIVGGADGSVTFLVLADNAAENAGMGMGFPFIYDTECSTCVQS